MISQRSIGLMEQNACICPIYVSLMNSLLWWCRILVIGFHVIWYADRTMYTPFHYYSIFNVNWVNGNLLRLNKLHTFLAISLKWKHFPWQNWTNCKYFGLFTIFRFCFGSADQPNIYGKVLHVRLLSLNFT